MTLPRVRCRLGSSSTTSWRSPTARCCSIQAIKVRPECSCEGVEDRLCASSPSTAAPRDPAVQRRASATGPAVAQDAPGRPRRVRCGPGHYVHLGPTACRPGRHATALDGVADQLAVCRTGRSRPTRRALRSPTWSPASPPEAARYAIGGEGLAAVSVAAGATRSDHSRSSIRCRRPDGRPAVPSAARAMHSGQTSPAGSIQSRCWRTSRLWARNWRPAQRRRLEHLPRSMSPRLESVKGVSQRNLARDRDRNWAATGLWAVSVPRGR